MRISPRNSPQYSARRLSFCLVLVLSLFLLNNSVSFAEKSFGRTQTDIEKKDENKERFYKELQICKRRVYLDYKRKLVKKYEAIERLQDCRASASYTKALKECKSNVVTRYKSKKLTKDEARKGLRECPSYAKNTAASVRAETSESIEGRNNCISAVLSEWLIEKSIDKSTAKGRIEDCKLGPQTFTGCTQSIMAQLRASKITEIQAKQEMARCMVR